MNILNLIREQISPETLGQISKSIGESPESTKNALSQALPALLGSAASQAATPNGATDLFATITRELPKLGSLSSLLGGSGGSGGGPGASFVSSLLGGKMNWVRDFISSRTGIRGESGTSLLSMAGSLLIGVLGKQMMSQKMDAGGFGQLLKSQVPHLQGLIPPELSKTLGLGNLLGTTQPTPQPSSSYTTQSFTPPPVSEPATYAAAPAPGSGSKALKWALVPALLLLAGLFFFRHSRNADMGATRDKTWSTSDTVVSPPRVDATAFADRYKDAVTSANGSPIELRDVSANSLGGLTTDSKTKLSALGKMINDHPSLKVTITAYGTTDAEAEGKANAIKTALATAGVSADRVSTQTATGEGWPKISFTK